MREAEAEDALRVARRDLQDYARHPIKDRGDEARAADFLSDANLTGIAEDPEAVLEALRAGKRYAEGDKPGSWADMEQARQGGERGANGRG